MARCTKDEAEKTRHAILDAAERVFYKKGVAHTSLDEIARVAGFTRGAVYWHFRNKIELCEAMLQRVYLPQEDVLERLAGSSPAPLRDLEQACADTLRLIARDRHRRRVFTILTYRCEYVEEMTAIMRRRRACRDRTLARFNRLFARAAELKMLAAGWTPQVAAASLQCLLLGLITNSIERRRNFDLDKTGTACLQAFFRAVGKAPLHARA